MLRRTVLGLVMVLATACSGTAVDRVSPGGTTTTEAPATTTSTTTTTVPVPASLQDLVTATTMTDRARRLFLAAGPAIEDAATFGRNCQLEETSVAATEARTHTQGCYVAGRIHLRAPDRPEAHGLLYVVAAHELLHAAYAALGPAERQRVDAEVEAARAGNERLEERLKPYTGGPTLLNEMHSILGSEFENLSPALEAHYAQYFADRGAVVAFRQRTLGAREDEIARLKAEIDDLEARIDTLRATQEELRVGGDIRSYNANVPVVNGLIDRYNARVDALNAQIQEYNGLLGG
ncbi:MAG: hypothetical protein ACRD1D_05520 [Acidimicrobiales bacterium]